MVNQSQQEILVLSGFQGLQQLRYLYFCLTCAGYLLAMVFNASILGLICLDRSLHQPMYILLANLLLNTLLGCTAFYPKLLHDLLRDEPRISRHGCTLQAFCVHVYVSVECNILMVMAYDRYAAVCHPMTYHRLLSRSRLCRLLAAAWSVPLVANNGILAASGTLPLCGARVVRVFCDNRSLTRLSCVDVSVIDLVELLVGAAVVFLPLLLIFSCYIKILAKALSTCVPHLVTYGSFVTSIVFEVIQPTLAGKKLPHIVRVFMSMEGFLVPPLLNPLIYGFKLPAIRNHMTLKLRQLRPKTSNRRKTRPNF